MTREEAGRAIAAALEEHRIRRTVHCRERMVQRGVSLEVVRDLLDGGALSEPRWDERYGDWQVVCTGRTVDGGRLRIRAAIAGSVVWLITVYAVRQSGGGEQDDVR